MEAACPSFQPKHALEVRLPLIHPEFCKWLLDKKNHARTLITATLEANIYDMIGLLNQHDISCIPIVDEQQIPVGIITSRDILKALEHQHKNQ